MIIFKIILGKSARALRGNSKYCYSHRFKKSNLLSNCLVIFSIFMIRFFMIRFFIFSFFILFVFIYLIFIIFFFFFIILIISKILIKTGHYQRGFIYTFNKVAVKRNLEMAIHYDPYRIPSLGKSAGKQWVICKNRAYPCKDTCVVAS